MRPTMASAAMVIALLAGCTGSGSEDAEPDPASSASTSTSTSSTTTVASATVEVVATIAVEPAVTLNLTTWDGRVAWGAGPDAEHIDRVDVWDETTGIVTTVARSTSPTGSTDWVRGDRDTIVFTDLARQASDDDPLTPWTIRTVDLVTGASKTIATSTPAEELGAPFPVIAWPWVVWIASDDTTSSVVAHNVDTDERRVLVADVAAVAVDIDGDDVAYSVQDAGGGRDVFVVGLDGGAPQQVTTTGLVQLFSFGDGMLSWTEEVDGVRAVWAAEQGGGWRPALVSETSAGNAVSGDGFVAWFAEDLTVSVAAADGGPALRMDTGPARVSARLDASGERLVWATNDRPERNLITVAEIAAAH